MSQAVKLPAIFASIMSKVDRSYKLTFVTRELSATDAANLLPLANAEAWLIIAPSEDEIDRADVPTYKPDAGVERKTPSQRLRAVVFLYWKQLGQPGDFDSFYASRLENLIDQYKGKLDGVQA